MNIANLCIERPIFALMVVAALVVLGAFSYMDLGVDLLPKADFPTVVVTTTYPGAGPEEVETQISKVIEEAVNTISGIDQLSSTSSEGFSQVAAFFQISKTSDECTQAVRDRVGRIQAKLPQGSGTPVIATVDPDASPVITVVVAAPMPVKELTDLARIKVKRSIETVSGVGQITMMGNQTREIHVNLDAHRLAALGLLPRDVKAALQRENVEVPGGVVKTGQRNLVLRTLGRIATPKDFSHVIVRQVGPTCIRVGDLGTVTDTEREPDSMARLNGKNAIALSIRKQSGTNTISVVRAVKECVEELKKALPADVELKTVRDQSAYILDSFYAVMEHLILGAILASLIVLVFLRDVRTTVMVALSIPTSIIATFMLMRVMGFTLNNMTLLALALAVGLVIDDAIVVHENAFRHMEELGKERRQATRDAASEIGLAVMATTFSLVVIFLPVAFMPGIVGRYLQSFGLTMTFAILVSLLISFTLTPMLCGHFLKMKPGTHGQNAHAKSLLDRFIEGGYGWMLSIAMRHRWGMVLIALTAILCTVPLGKMVGTDFLPVDDQSEFLINITTPEGSPLETTSAALAEVEMELTAFPEVRTRLATIGEDQTAGTETGQIYVGLVGLEERKTTQVDVMNRARALLARKFSHLHPSVSTVPLWSTGQGKMTDLSLGLQGPDLAKLRTYSDEAIKIIRQVKGTIDVESSLSFGKPELQVRIDRERAGALGLSVADIGETIHNLVGSEEEVSKYRDEARGEDYDLRVRLSQDFRNRPELISRFPLKTPKGMITLSDLATVTPGKGPTQIGRFARQRQVTVTANLQGIGLGEAQAQIDARMKKLSLEPGYSYTFLGLGKVLKEQQTGFAMAFLLSAVFVYMILAAQFESLVHPLTILLSLPLCIPYGLLSLVLTGVRLNLYSTLGLFMLFGIVKKNAILQVDYANTLRAKGKDAVSAITEACHTRMRPILMTTLTLVAGMIPMALGSGPGAEGRRGLAIVVVGGQLLCLQITLLLTPVAYSLFDDFVNSRFVRWFTHLLD